MNNELKVSFYLKRESRLEKSNREDVVYPIHRKQYRSIFLKTACFRTALECQVRTGYRQKPCSHRTEQGD